MKNLKPIVPFISYFLPFTFHQRRTRLWRAYLLPFTSYFLFAASLSLISSCRPDEENFTATRDTYLGVWKVEEYENGAFAAAYEIQIVEHPSDASKILVDNFAQLGIGNRAEAVINNTQLDIPQQNITGTITSGFGTLKNEGKILDLNYSLDDQSSDPVKYFTATLTKQ